MRERLTDHSRGGKKKKRCVMASGRYAINITMACRGGSKIEGRQFKSVSQESKQERPSSGTMREGAEDVH